ncbi:ATP-dependent Clp protease adapter ClpS [Nocardia africana]|uniref:ATP-dependent Clp protease adapter protein ClpS n=1 Tax=Nocardia africana TaxID=134964 RepID=A0ABW6NP90_9NOCA
MRDAVRIAAGPGGANQAAARATGPQDTAWPGQSWAGRSSRVCVVAGQLSAAQATPETVEVTEILEAEDRPWVTVVWDDPVNLMHYVTYIFQKLFGYSKAKATELMLQVHNEGKAVVSSGSRDRMEHDVQRLHAAGLWATMQRDQ